MKLLSTATGDPPTEMALLERCLDGDREAFRELVERQQSLVCAITFSACGRVAVSEELAQEVFVIAWRQLATLREPGHFKAWLCGIARNVANSATRREQRRGTEVPLEAAAELPHGGPGPDEAVIRQEEEALVWEAIAGIPEIYREPLVLYYREQQSMRAVAAALDLTEEAVRQRLSRGRSLLKEQVAAAVERTLSGSGPKQALALGVLAAIAKPATASAATVAGTAATSSGWVAKGIAAGKIVSLLFWPVLQIGLLIQGLRQRRQEMREARTERERNFLLRRDNFYFPVMILMVIVLSLAACFLFAGVPHKGLANGVFIMLPVFIYILWSQRRLRRIQLEDGTRTEPEGIWNPVLDRDGKLTRWNAYYRVGLPIALQSLAVWWFADRAGEAGLASGMLAMGIAAGIWGARRCERAPRDVQRVFTITKVFFNILTLLLLNWRWPAWLAAGVISPEWTVLRMNLVFLAWVLWGVLTRWISDKFTGQVKVESAK